MTEEDESRLQRIGEKLQIITRRRMRYPRTNKDTIQTSSTRHSENKTMIKENPTLPTRLESATLKQPLKNEILKQVYKQERTRNTELVASLDNSICVLNLKTSRKSKTQFDGRYKSVRPTTAAGFNFRKIRPNHSVNLRPVST